MKTLLPKLSSWRAIALVLAILISVPAAAQNLTVRGKVIDESGAPLPGAGIVIEGTTNGTTSDVDGNFNPMSNQGIEDLNPQVQLGIRQHIGGHVQKAQHPPGQRFAENGGQHAAHQGHQDGGMHGAVYGVPVVLLVHLPLCTPTKM